MSTVEVLHAAHAVSPVQAKCRLCRCKLDGRENDDLTRELCSSCQSRPEARRLGTSVHPLGSRGSGSEQRLRSARAFTAAEKALIRKVHGYMPAPQLLDILNERLACDLGPDVMPYTMEQLYAEIGDASAIVPPGGHDWASLRKLLARAKDAGVLDAITEQVINDFAVVFSLNQKQLVVLKDIVLQAKED